MEMEPAKEEAVDDKNGGERRAGDEGDSEGMCHVCWEKEIQVRTWAQTMATGHSLCGTVLWIDFCAAVAAKLAPSLSVFGVAPAMFLRGTPGTGEHD